MLAQLISPVSGLLDKFIEDKDQKNALAHEISTMAERHAQELAMSQIAVNQEEARSEEHTSELQSRLHLVCRLLLEKKKNKDLP